MSQPKVVLYSAFGRTLPALVLSARDGEVSHLGVNGEPLLTVVFFDPERESKGLKSQIGNSLFIEHDVVHASHEFSDEFLRKHNLTKETATPAHIAAYRGHGEWKEVLLLEAPAEAPASPVAPEN